MSALKPLTITILTLFCLIGFGGNYSFDEKINMLYEAMPEANPQKFKKELSSYINQLKAYNSQAPAKKIKKIFTLTKKKYLGDYYLYAFFPEIYTHGHFNCVTGTALFAVIFDELNIPYSIVEVPQHVYLVAYPESHRIGVESTSERNGVYSWTEHTKLDAVNFLINIEKVTEQEVRLRGIDATLEEYFYTNDEMTFDGIAGIHLINRALFLSDRKEHKEALACLKRAQELYEGPTLDMIKGSVLIELITTTDISNIDMIDYITEYYTICQTTPEKQRSLKNFEYVVNDALITRRDLVFIDSTEKLIKANLNPTDQKLFQALVEKTKAIWHHNRGKYDEALLAAETSITLNPKNMSVEDLLATCLINALTESDLFDEEICEIVIDYTAKYPFLNTSPRFVNFSISVYAIMASEFFTDNMSEEGEKYLVLMGDLLQSPEVDLEEVSWYVGDAYAECATYHFRQQHYQEALKWIDLALTYDPESDLHMSRRQNILDKL